MITRIADGAGVSGGGGPKTPNCGQSVSAGLLDARCVVGSPTVSDVEKPVIIGSAAIMILAADQIAFRPLPVPVREGI